MDERTVPEKINYRQLDQYCIGTNRYCDDEYKAVDEIDEWRKNHPWLTNRQLQMRYLRTSHNMSCPELAAVIGVPYKKIMAIERGNAWSDEIYWAVIKFFYETDPGFRELLIAQNNARKGIHKCPPCS